MIATMTPDDVTTKRFQATKFREGYDQDQVDEFLDQISPDDFLGGGAAPEDR